MDESIKYLIQYRNELTLSGLAYYTAWPVLHPNKKMHFTTTLDEKRAVKKILEDVDSMMVECKEWPERAIRQVKETR